MAHLKKIRQALGLTYREMATYLHIPLSVYSMAENSLRELPSQASLQFTLLEMGLFADAAAGYESVKDKHRSDQQRLLFEWCKDAIQGIELQLYKEQQQLEKVNARSLQADKLLLAICHREQAIVSHKANNGDNLQYAYLKQLSLQRLSAYGMLAQAKISLRIQMLENELAELKTLLKAETLRLR